MTDNELRDIVAAKAEVDVSVVDRVLVALQETVLLSMRANEDVVLNGFGIFHRPSRSVETPPFTYMVDVGEPEPEIPDVILEPFGPDEREALTRYLMENRATTDVFGLDRDPYPGLDPRFKPQRVTRSDAVQEAHRPTRRFDPDRLVERVTQNLRASIG